jgi:ribonuclease Z
MTIRMLRRGVLAGLGATAGTLVALARGQRPAFAGTPLHGPPGRPPFDRFRRGPAERNTLFSRLKPYYPGTEELAPGEMRITFMGTSVIPRLTQACNSVFVELGNEAKDSFVFDAGAGVIVKYVAMGIRYGQMDKVFLTHLHGDHTTDLAYIYCFGPAGDRKSPLYVWGPTRSDIPNPYADRPGEPEFYDDGTEAFCRNLRETWRWHTEAFGFLPTSYSSFEPPPFDPAGHRDGYDLVPFELPWREVDVAYEHNDVTITHFPAVHDRQGSISYKLEWNGLSMIFTGDTRPTEYVIEQANDGVDVLIHEMVVPPEVWAAKNTGLEPGDPGWEQALFAAQQIENNSHTPAKAFGYILNRLAVPPRLAVATHFQATDDTIFPALRDIRRWYPHGDVTVASDLLVINVSKDKIRQRRAVVSEYAWLPPPELHPDVEEPKYSTPEGVGDPYAQLDPDAPVIPEELYDI